MASAGTLEFSVTAKVDKASQALDSMGNKLKKFSSDVGQIAGVMTAFGAAMVATASKYNAGVAGAVKGVQSAYAGLAVEIGRALIPTLLSLGNILNNITGAWRSLSPATRESATHFVTLAAGIGGAVAAAAKIGSVFASLVAMIAPVLIPLAGVAAVIFAIVLATGVLRLAWDQNFAGMRDKVTGLIGVLKELKEWLTGAAAGFKKYGDEGTAALYGTLKKNNKDGRYDSTLKDLDPNRYLNDQLVPERLQKIGGTQFSTSTDLAAGDREGVADSIKGVLGAGLSTFGDALGEASPKLKAFIEGLTSKSRTGGAGDTLAEKWEAEKARDKADMDFMKASEEIRKQLTEATMARGVALRNSSTEAAGLFSTPDLKEAQKNAIGTLAVGGQAAASEFVEGMKKAVELAAHKMTSFGGALSSAQARTSDVGSEMSGVWGAFKQQLLADMNNAITAADANSALGRFNANVDEAANAARSYNEKIIGVIGQLASAADSATSRKEGNKLNGMMSSVVQGAASGGIWGAIIAVIMNLLSRMKTFGAAMDMVGDGLEETAAVFAPIFEILKAINAASNKMLSMFSGNLMRMFEKIVAMIMNVLSPVLETVTDVFGMLADALNSIFAVVEMVVVVLDIVNNALNDMMGDLNVTGLVLKVVGWILKYSFESIRWTFIGILYVVRGIMWVSQWFTRAIGDIIRAIALVFPEGAIRDALLTAANGFFWMADILNGVVNGTITAIDTLENIDFNRVGAAAQKSAEGLEKLNEAFTNVPTGYRVSAAQFSSSDVEFQPTPGQQEQGLEGTGGGQRQQPPVVVEITGDLGKFLKVANIQYGDMMFARTGTRKWP